MSFDFSFGLSKISDKLPTPSLPKGPKLSEMTGKLSDKVSGATEKMAAKPSEALENLSDKRPKIPQRDKLPQTDKPSKAPQSTDGVLGPGTSIGEGLVTGLETGAWDPILFDSSSDAVDAVRNDTDVGITFFGFTVPDFGLDFINKEKEPPKLGLDLARKKKQDDIITP